MLTVALGKPYMSRTQVKLCYNRFAESRESRPGRPSTSRTNENINAVKKMILDNRRITIREATDDFTYRSAYVNVLGMKLIAAKIVLNLLNFEQKQHRIDIAHEI